MSTEPMLTIVAAIDARYGLGKDNTLAWHIPEDMAHFKAVTMGKPIIMGRKTFDSIGRALPGRRNIVVSRNPDYIAENCETVTSVDAAIELVRGTPACIIGGAQIYEAALPYANAMILTELWHAYDCDVAFPFFSSKQWEQTARTHHTSANGLRYDIATYARREAGQLIAIDFNVRPSTNH